MAKDKKKDAKKAEKSVHPPIPAQDTTTESSSTKVTDVQTLMNAVEETQGNPVIPDKELEKVEESPVQDVPQCYEEPVLTQVIVKRYACYKYISEVKHSRLSISGVPSVMQTQVWFLI